MSIIELANRRVENERKKYKQTLESLIEENVIKNKGKNEWNDMCYMPVERIFDELQKIFFEDKEPSKDNEEEVLELYKNASMMAAFSGWGKNNKKIKTATLHEDNSEIPFLVNTKSIFQRTGLGLYIDCEFNYAPYIGCDFMGAIVHINQTSLDNPSELELRAYFLTDDRKDCFPCKLVLINGKTLSTCLCETLGIDKNDLTVGGHIPSLREMYECTNAYQRDLLDYKLKYKIFKDLFGVLFSE